jgi:hypothetical protein
MAGLDPAIHIFVSRQRKQDVVMAAHWIAPRNDTSAHHDKLI